MMTKDELARRNWEIQRVGMTTRARESSTHASFVLNTSATMERRTHWHTHPPAGATSVPTCGRAFIAMYASLFEYEKQLVPSLRVAETIHADRWVSWIKRRDHG
ncbi:uncharacterized protein LOC122535039 [Frieseomelitta varia]|uniref:uncharacterized protein LOC122535039 n=1 Tax=Frieseomelitta varia TaxID=561572 RepID=UPI001CB6A230|nr:uncharacterized protein LOC122535039 [Frieseomelitta varia]